MMINGIEALFTDLLAICITLFLEMSHLDLLSSYKLDYLRFCYH